MTRFSVCGTLVACILGVMSTSAKQQPVFKGTTDVVRVFVTVTDKDSPIVTTLDTSPTSRCATKASLSRSRFSTTARNPSGSSCC